VITLIQLHGFLFNCSRRVNTVIFNNFLPINQKTHAIITRNVKTIATLAWCMNLSGENDTEFIFVIVQFDVDQIVRNESFTMRFEF
jgi:hypothetical protein